MIIAGYWLLNNSGSLPLQYYFYFGAEEKFCIEGEVFKGKYFGKGCTGF